MAFTRTSCPKCGTVLSFEGNRPTIRYNLLYSICPNCKSVVRNSLATEVILRELSHEEWEYAPLFELGSPKHCLGKEAADESLIRLTSKYYVESLIQGNFFTRKQYDDFYDMFIANKGIEDFESNHSVALFRSPDCACMNIIDTITINALDEILKDKYTRNEKFLIYNTACHIIRTMTINKDSFKEACEKLKDQKPELTDQECEFIIVFAVRSMRSDITGANMSKNQFIELAKTLNKDSRYGEYYGSLIYLNTYKDILTKE